MAEVRIEDGKDSLPIEVVAVCVDSKRQAKAMVRDLTFEGFAAATTRYKKRWFAWITDLRDTDPEDAIFELGWHCLDVGLIPNPTLVESEK